MTLKELRLKKFFKSQQYIANQLGVSLLAYSGWERGVHGISQSNYDKLVKLFGEAPSDLKICEVGRPLA